MAPGVNATPMLALPGTAVPMVGASGKVLTPPGTTEFDHADHALVPAVLVVLAAQA